jgi:hypothetical protein
MNKLRNKLMGILLLILPLYFFSCSDDDKEDPKVLLPKAEGFYVFGENTVATEPSEPAARMAFGLLDPTKAPNTTTIDSVYGKYIYIGAGGSINFAAVSGEEDGVLLGSNDAIVENGVEHNSVNDNIIHGTIEEGGDAIEVEEGGLYYVFVDMNNLTFTITRVKGQVIGDALVDLAWSAGTVLAEKSSSVTETIFEATDVKMQVGGFKFRFNEGWHSFTNESMSTFSFLGELSYGDAWAIQEINPGFFNDNIPCFAAGLYTVTLKFTANPSGGEGVWTGTIAKTGELPINYTNHNMSINGNAIAGTNFNGDGTGGYGGHVPVKSGNIYTWTWNDAVLIAEGEFIFLQNATWGGLLVDFVGAATVNGTAVTAGSVVNATTVGKEFANFYVVTGGTYDITLAIDGTNNSKTVTINNN